MIQSSHIADIEAVHQLLTSYSFEVESYQTKAIVAGWLAEFGPVWVSHAITEALYQGRYKLISIDQILKLWQRRGQPIRHFNREFESIILGQTLLYATGYGDRPEPSTPRRSAAPETPPEPPSTPAPESIAIEAQAEPAQAEPDQADLTGQEPATAAQDTPSDSDEARVLKSVDEPTVAEDSAAGEEQTALAEPAASHDALESSTTVDGPNGAVPNFRPVDSDGSSRWPQIEVIQTFVPRRDESELHERLRAVVQGGMRE